MTENVEHDLWVELFRPGTLDGYIGNENLIEKATMWIKTGELPMLLLYGKAGTGKTTLAKILANSIDSQVMYINASDENSVDVVRDKIKRFASSVGFSKWKIIILDEFDYMTPNAMATLRNLMETYSKTTRFILTCNYVEKVIDPIQSRCQVFEITPPNKAEVAKRLATILDSKMITYKLEDIATIINSSYPDIRRAINSAQASVVDNELKLTKSSSIQSNYMTEILEILMSSGSVKDKFAKVRKCIADSKVRDFQPLYTFLYEKVDDFAVGHVGPVILIIAEAQSKDVHVVDKEINVMAMFIQLLNELG